MSNKLIKVNEKGPDSLWINPEYIQAISVYVPKVTGKITPSDMEPKAMIHLKDGAKLDGNPVMLGEHGLIDKVEPSSITILEL